MIGPAALQRPSGPLLLRRADHHPLNGKLQKPCCTNRFTVLRFEVDLLHTSFNHNGSSDVRLAIGGAIHF